MGIDIMIDLKSFLSQILTQNGPEYKPSPNISLPKCTYECFISPGLIFGILWYLSKISLYKWTDEQRKCLRLLWLQAKDGEIKNTKLAHKDTHIIFITIHSTSEYKSVKFKNIIEILQVSAGFILLCMWCVRAVNFLYFL